MENIVSENLSVQDAPARHVVRAHALVVGEVLWDVFPDATRLGGAALNFAVHLKRLGHVPRIVSAVGRDALGDTANAAITSLGLDTTFLQWADRFNTGTASVQLGPGDRTSFVIERPAAYDAVEISDAILTQIVQWKPSWCYYGTLFASRPHGRQVLQRLLDALPGARRFYDINLRPGFESRELACDLLHLADVVKLNERELTLVCDWLGSAGGPREILPRRRRPLWLAGGVCDARRTRLRDARGRRLRRGGQCSRRRGRHRRRRRRVRRGIRARAHHGLAGAESGRVFESCRRDGGQRAGRDPEIDEESGAAHRVR